jgi:hypothetical protein
MDVSNASYYIIIHENNENKGSQMGHTKKKKKKKKQWFGVKNMLYLFPNIYMTNFLLNRFDFFMLKRNEFRY